MRSLTVGVAFTKKLFVDQYQSDITLATAAVASWFSRANLLYNSQLNLELVIGTRAYVISHVMNLMTSLIYV